MHWLAAVSKLWLPHVESVEICLSRSSVLLSIQKALGREFVDLLLNIAQPVKPLVAGAQSHRLDGFVQTPSDIRSSIGCGGSLHGSFL